MNIQIYKKKKVITYQINLLQKNINILKNCKHFINVFNINIFFKIRFMIK